MDKSLVDLSEVLGSAFNAQAREKFRQQQAVLEDRVFAGLPFEQLRAGNMREKFFRAGEFLQIIERCEVFGIRI